MADLCGPELHILLFFSARSAAPRIDLGLPERLSLAPGGPGDAWQFTGNLPDGGACRLDGALAHDTQLMRLALSAPAGSGPDALPRLKAAGVEILRSALEDRSAPRPWAISILHLVETVGAMTAASLDDWAVPVRQGPPGTFENTPFGWLQVTGEGGLEIGAGLEEIPQRALLLITPLERAEPVRRYFTGPLGQGAARIELYLHKARHHSRQQFSVRTDLVEAHSRLQESMTLALQAAGSNGLHQHKIDPEDISQDLMRFLTQKACAEVLLNSLRANRSALDDHLDRVKLEAESYRRELASIDRLVEQLESDLENARAVSESTYAFQDIQRGMEASRLERAGHLMSGTAGLLAGIAIFNSFLDIWSLAVLDTGLVMPPAWLRILLGLLAGVSLPLGAFRIVERRRRQAAFWLAVGAGSVAAAALSTLVVN